MKKISIGLFTIILLSITGAGNVNAKGGGKTFGASLGGSFLGSYIGSSVANSSNNNSSSSASADNDNAAYRNLDLENDRLNKKLKKAYDMIDSLEDQVQALKKKEDSLNEQLRMARKEIKNLETNVQTLQGQLKKSSSQSSNKTMNQGSMKNKSLMQRVETDVDQDIMNIEKDL